MEPIQFRIKLYIRISLWMNAVTFFKKKFHKKIFKLISLQVWPEKAKQKWKSSK